MIVPEPGVRPARRAARQMEAIDVAAMMYGPERLDEPPWSLLSDLDRRQPPCQCAAVSPLVSELDRCLIARSGDD